MATTWSRSASNKCRRSPCLLSWRLWRTQDIGVGGWKDSYIYILMITNICHDIYTWKAIIPFFWSNGLDHFFWSLRLWSSGATCVRAATAFYGLFSTKCRKNTVLPRVGLRESCDGFFRRFFSTKCWKNTVLLRVGLQCSLIWQFFVITGKNNILPKKMFITAFSHNDQKILCFWLSRYILNIYIFNI